MFSKLFFAFAMLTVAGVAVPLRSRQIGDLECNINRLQIVKSLSDLQGSLTSLASTFASDNEQSNAQEVAAAQGGVTGAQGAIAVIANALVTGQTAPADERTQVGNNLTVTISAMGNITTTDPNAQTLLSTAQGQLNSSIAAAQGVSANCN